jgi:uncharacterized protein YndB with AHSA1/START domain
MSPSTDYEFVTIWQLEAPIEEVWEELYHPERWPQWWKGVESAAELRAGDESGVGALQRYVWKSRLPYKLAFNMQTTRVQSPHTLEGAARGELEGTGRWRLSHNDGVTTVRYTWQVRTTKPWMRVLAPLARPIFEWNHDVVMRQGGEGLARVLGARLVSAEGVRRHDAHWREVVFGLVAFLSVVIVLLVLRTDLSKLLTYLRGRGSRAGARQNYLR